MNDIIVQFARLWGQYEVSCISNNEESLSNMMKEYDSLDLRNLLQQWAHDYLYGQTDDEYVEDSVEYFETRLKTLHEESKNIAEGTI